MKTRLTLILVLVTFCTSAQKSEPYKPAWPAEWTINQKSSALDLVLKLQKAAENNDYETARSLFHENFTAVLADGSTLKGYEDLDNTFKNLVDNYKIRIRPMTWIPLTDKSTGQQWVLLWTYEYLESPEGEIQQIAAHENFRVEDGKIVYISQWQRTLNL